MKEGQLTAWEWIQNRPEARKALTEQVGKFSDQQDLDVLSELAVESGFSIKQLLDALVINDDGASALNSFIIPDC